MKAPELSSVLKSGHALFDPQPRALRSLAAPKVGAAVPSIAEEAAPEGQWLSMESLKELQAQCEARGRKLGAAEAAEAAESKANERAQRELEERLQKQAAAQAEKWRGLASALAGEAQALRESLDSQVTEWTFIAATRLLGQLPLESVASAVRQVLSEARIEEPLTVLLHPMDFADLERAQELWSETWPAHINFKPDELVTLGGCRIKSAHQNLDARLEVQLTLLREALDGARESRNER